jgi:hypothetical protein
LKKNTASEPKNFKLMHAVKPLHLGFGAAKTDGFILTPNTNRGLK